MRAPLHAPYFFVAPSQVSQGRIFLQGSDARHLRLVRRAKTGDRILGSDGSGVVYEAAIETISPEKVAARIVRQSREPSPRPVITVLQGLSRGSKIDFVIEKLTEIGVDRIAVFWSGRSVARWDEAKQQTARDRWEKIAIEASKQSHRAWHPTVAGPLEPARAAALCRESELSFVADPNAQTRLKEALDSVDVDSVAVTVGPEGGLSPQEISRLQEAGATPVSLGRQILKTETAGLVLASLVMFQLGRLG